VAGGAHEKQEARNESHEYFLASRTSRSRSSDASQAPKASSLAKRRTKTRRAGVAASGVGGRLHFVGFLTHDRLPAVMSHADLLVLPSLYEELGTVLLEAMQAGLPIVASKTGGIPDVIEDGVNGMLVPPGDPEAIALAIDRLLANRDLARRLSEGAQEGGKDYDWEMLAGRVLRVYRGVTAGRLAPGGPRDEEKASRRPKLRR
jgi:glycosyltransferase involved in cell wall biosynthesis